MKTQFSLTYKNQLPSVSILRRCARALTTPPPPPRHTHTEQKHAFTATLHVLAACLDDTAVFRARPTHFTVLRRRANGSLCTTHWVAKDSSISMELMRHAPGGKRRHYLTHAPRTGWQKTADTEHGPRLAMPSAIRRFTSSLKELKGRSFSALCSPF